MTALVLVLVLGATDGGVVEPNFKVPIYGACVDGPPAVLVDGGAFYPQARHERVACLMATCDVDRQRKATLLAAQPPPPSFVLWGVGVTAALLVGWVVGYLLPRPL